MRLGRFYRIFSIVLVLCSLHINATAQKIVRLSVPAYMCKGADDTLSFGFEPECNILVGHGTSTLGHTERIFLPDGEVCDGNCSYVSPVTFTDFATDDTIRSVEDIYYVRINMEHSFIGDIYMGITCPNGQQASLMNWSSAGSSPCRDSVPMNHRGWNTAYSNTNGGAYLGLAYDHGGTPICDSTVPANAPGIGWNYCWSDNTTMGYQYAPQDGRIYRAVNVNGNSIDSSNVAAGTNFYHPDQSFSNLIGCPLNGTWTIEVIDAFSQDNGYIFEWDLALDPTLIPIDTEACTIVSYEMEGYGVSRVNDSLFSVHAPDTLVSDSSCTYLFRVITSCGDTLDTTATITFLAPRISHDTIVACDRYWVNSQQYITEDTETSQHFYTVRGCDSAAVRHIIIHQSQTLHVTEHVTVNDLPHTYEGNVFSGPVEDLVFHHTAANGCDSNIYYTLVVDNAVYDTVDISICANQTPYLWNGLSISTTSSHTVTLTASSGMDSVVTLNLTINPVHNHTVTFEALEKHLPVIFNGIAYYESTDTLFRFTNIYGCDSLVRYLLTIHKNQHINLSQTICDNMLPFQWAGHTFTEADTLVFEYTDRYGADSIVSLALAVNPTYRTAVDTAVCSNVHFDVGGHTFDASGHYTVILTASNGCDSTIDLDINIMPYDETTLSDVLCYGSEYEFDGRTYSSAGTYTHRYTNRNGCDSLLILTLNVLSEDLRAEITASPLIVTLSNLDVHLYDCSRHNVSRLWDINGSTFTERSVTYTFPFDADSLPVVLVAYSTEGCADTATTTILIDRSALTIPNAFTPDQAENNHWYPVQFDMQSMEVWIYDRQGRLVAHLEGLDDYWDGTHDGTPCPQGAYVYTLKYRSTLRPDMPQSQTGTILLLR